MDGILSKIVTIIMVVLLLFGTTLNNEYWLMERKIYSHVNTLTFQFAKTVRNKGYVNKTDYENFLKDLSKTGRYYDVKMLYTKILYYPLTPSSPGYTVQKPYSEENFKYGNSAIFAKLYNITNPQDYIMPVGDNFKITVADDGTLGTRIFNKFLNNNRQGGEILAVYGGAIGNESD